MESRERKRVGDYKRGDIPGGYPGEKAANFEKRLTSPPLSSSASQSSLKPIVCPVLRQITKGSTSGKEKRRTRFRSCDSWLNRTLMELTIIISLCAQGLSGDPSRRRGLKPEAFGNGYFPLLKY